MKSRIRLVLGVVLLAIFITALCTSFGAAATTGWSQTYGGSGDDEAYSLVQTSDGGYALAGFTASYGAGSYDAFLVKTDSSGNSMMPQSSFSIPYSTIAIVVVIIAVIIIAVVFIARSRRSRSDTGSGQQYPPPSPEVKPP
jgi:subtilase family serine protease